MKPAAKPAVLRDVSNIPSGELFNLNSLSHPCLPQPITIRAYLLPAHSVTVKSITTKGQGKHPTHKSFAIPLKRSQPVPAAAVKESENLIPSGLCQTKSETC